MAFKKFEQVAISSVVKTSADLTIPATATRAHLQASSAGSIRYTMDGATVPSTTSGMLLRSTSDPLDFLIEDVKNIKFVRDGSTDSSLLIHYA